MRRGKYAYVYVNDEEVGALADAVGMSKQSFRRSHTLIDDRGWTQLRFTDDFCPFLDRATNRCTVYEARPVQCRTFPFWGDMIDERGWTHEAHTLCEGVGRGPLQPADLVEASIQEMKDAD
jgi:uncharacterized protein